MKRGYFLVRIQEQEGRYGGEWNVTTVWIGTTDLLISLWMTWWPPESADGSFKQGSVYLCKDAIVVQSSESVDLQSVPLKLARRITLAPPAIIVNISKYPMLYEATIFHRDWLNSVADLVTPDAKVFWYGLSERLGVFSWTFLKISISTVTSNAILLNFQRKRDVLYCLTRTAWQTAML